MKRLICILLALTLLCGCSSSAVSGDSTSTEPSASETEKVMERAKSMTSDIDSEAPDAILTFEDIAIDGWDAPRAVASADLTTISNMSESEFVTLCKSEVEPLLSDHAYVTLDYSDGTGLVFLKDLSTIYYGAIDGNGAITETYRYYSISGRTLSYQDAVQSIDETTTQPDAAQRQQPTEKMVWIPTNGGTKYHRKPDCSGMEDPIEVTESEAIAQGFEPCGRCHP